MIINEAFCLTNKTLYTAEEFKEFIKSYRGVKRKEYTEFLVCPFCKITKCTFIYKRKSSYFELEDFAEHRDGCIFNLDEIQQSKIKQLIINRNLSLIERNINNIFHVYYEDSTDIKTTIELKIKERFPQIRLENKLTAPDFGKYAIFYGNVIIEPHFQNNKYIILRSKNSNEIICQLDITETIYKFLPKEYKQEKSYTGFICFLGFFSRVPSKEEKYHTSPIVDSRLLKIGN